jgi:Putative peptidase family
MHSAINISNINNGECLSYPLVMIKGQITSAQTLSKPGGSILVKVEGKVQKWPVVEGNFKILLMLDEGVNKIELEFESASHELELSFEPREGKYTVTPVYIISK